MSRIFEALGLQRVVDTVALIAGRVAQFFTDLYETVTFW